MKNIIKGGLIAIFTAGLIIFLWESERSLLQFFCGFFLFILPVTFLSSFRSTFMSFLFVIFSILVFYVIYRFSFYDAIIGIILAIVVGGYLFYSRVNKSRPFSAIDFKNNAINKKEEN